MRIGEEGMSMDDDDEELLLYDDLTSLKGGENEREGMSMPEKKNILCYYDTTPGPNYP